MQSARLLVQAYANGEACGGEIDWSEVDVEALVQRFRFYGPISSAGLRSSVGDSIASASG